MARPYTEAELDEVRTRKKWQEGWEEHGRLLATARAAMNALRAIDIMASDVDEWDKEFAELHREKVMPLLYGDGRG